MRSQKKYPTVLALIIDQPTTAHIKISHPRRGRKLEVVEEHLMGISPADISRNSTLLVSHTLF